MSQVERRRRPGRQKNWNAELATVVEGPSSLEERIEAGQDRRPVVAPRMYVCMYVCDGCRPPCKFYAGGGEGGG